MANLVIVESPAKANTIKSYLGSNYKVIASKGHIRDLPKSTLGIDIEAGFEPHYINIRGKGDIIKELKREAKSATKVFLATDPDREGEAISWHIAGQLGIPEDRACRVTFNEITKTAVKEAIKNPRRINTDLVNSQQARRILDRLVGFNLSQVLWKNVGSGLSGGRVQSVAARIIVEREKEIRAFVPKEYWTIDATLASDTEESLDTVFFGDKKGRIRPECEKDASEIIDRIKAGSFKVTAVKSSHKQRAPQPPFTTSTLQQEASRKLGFQSQKTMKVAQELYDGLNLGHSFGGVQGLITYMRTDSTRISSVASDAARVYIANNYGEEYLPRTARVYKSKTDSQDAHEAIRPSNIDLNPKDIKKMLTSDQYKLYKLVFDRFIASQMASALIDTVSVDIENSGYVFKTGGSVVKAPGFMVVYGAEDIESEDGEDINIRRLPTVKKGQELQILSLSKKQHFTEPPARYTEATLIKFLEENGIGRPSTYAPIISIILGRNYVKREGRSLVGTELGEITTDFMKKYFPEIVDYEFTAFMENKLDCIENSKDTIEGVIGSFYGRFAKELEFVSENGNLNVLKLPAEVSDYKCPNCGKNMIYKNGRFGRFLACPDYPGCKSTVAVDKDGAPVKPKEPAKLSLAGFECKMCGKDMVIRNGRFGSFYACSDYPNCKYTMQRTIDIGVECPECGSAVVAKQAKGGSVFYSCSTYPKCNFSTWDRPLGEKCPECGKTLYYKKTKRTVICKSPDCSYERQEQMKIEDFKI